MRAALGLCAFLIASLATAGGAAQAGPSASVPEWFVRGVVAALQDAAPGVPGAALKLARAREAVFAAAKAGPEPVRKKLLTEVQALLNSQDPSVRRAAAATLAGGRTVRHPCCVASRPGRHTRIRVSG